MNTSHNSDERYEPLWREPDPPHVDNHIITNSFATGTATGLDPLNPLDPQNLKPNHAYQSPGIEYFTDEHRLPARVRRRLQLVAQEQRTRHPPAQRNTGKQGGPGYDGGHIIAVSLGGYPSGPNLSPQMSNMNRSAYKRLENGWRSALADGITVEVDISLTFDPANPAVAPHTIAHWWENNEPWDLALLNEAHSQ